LNDSHANPLQKHSLKTSTSIKYFLECWIF
jgi:hypothetical protein